MHRPQRFFHDIPAIPFAPPPRCAAPPPPHPSPPPPPDARPRRTTTLSHSERWPRRRRYDSSSPCRADRISAESSVRSPNEVGLSRIRVRSWKYYTLEKSFSVPVTSR